MRLRSAPVLGLICMGSILAMDTNLDCKDVAMSGLLDAVWFGASTAANQAMIDANNENQAGHGQPGAPGADGINCWDLNMNGVNDPEEDVNGDSEWNALDCQGLSGDNGQDARGQPGLDGTNGFNCWDFNANGVNDPAEDLNGDGEWNALDCQGLPGENGANGMACWDLNGNGINDLAEDVNGDGEWNALDCQGLPGDNGTNGLACWDLNGNGLPDPAEDVSGPNGVPDGNWDAWDCQGMPGQDGEDLTGVIARGVIPGTDIPEPNDPDPYWEPDPNTAVGILRVYRPENPQGPTTRGRYRVIVDLPDRTPLYTNAEIITLVSIEAVHVDGGPPGSGGPTAQAFGFWEIVDINNDEDTVELEVMIRTAPLNFFTDATFSLVVLLP